MDDAGAGNILSVTSAQGADSTQEVGGAVGVEGGIGAKEGKRLHWRAQAVGGPLPPVWYEPGGRWISPAQCNPGGRGTPPAWCDQRGGSPLKTQV